MPRECLSDVALGQRLLPEAVRRSEKLLHSLQGFKGFKDFEGFFRVLRVLRV